MKIKQVILLCILSAVLGAFATLGTQSLFSRDANQKTSRDSNRAFSVLTNEDSHLTNLPDTESLESQFFQNFFGEEHFERLLGTNILQRRDENYFYFEMPLKDTEQSKLRTNLVGDYIEISGEITERKQSGKSGESMVQRNFSQTLPLPREVDPSTLQIISEPNKTVIRFERKKK
jgi:HSP20 family molecular chaperone IbpA